MKIESGAYCTLNSGGDLFMDSAARPFIGASCVVVKTTKSGLIQVALATDMRKTYSAPARNIELTPNGEVRGASRPAGEASSREAATSTVVLGGLGSQQGEGA